MSHTPPSAQRGVSLVELMVSMVIGLVIVGAVFANYLTQSSGAKQTAALNQITDDATTAFGILRSQIAMAGYSEPTGVNATTNNFDKPNLGLGLLGCNGGFATDDTGIGQTDINAIRCVAQGGTSSDALMVRYQADTDNTPQVTNGATGVTSPSDCLGNAITTVDATAGVIIADNRFRLDNTKTETERELECSGSGTRSQGARALVQNIADMQLTYGVGTSGVVTRYVRADEVAQAGATGAATAWASVIAVRVCLLVRSTDEVLDSPKAYRDCNGTVTTRSNDRRMYRAFTSTIVLNNRVANPG